MAGIPAGMESDTDDDEFGDYDDYLPQPKRSNGVQIKEIESSPNSSKVGVTNGSQNIFHSNIKSPPFPSSNTNENMSYNGTSSNSMNNKQTEVLRTPYRSESFCGVQEEDFRVAILKGNETAVKSMLAKGFDPNFVLKSGWTGLMYAAMCAQPDIMKHLLENKADPNFHKENYTSLMAACASVKPEEQLLKCVEQLLEAGADVNAAEKGQKMTPLIYSCRAGMESITAKLIEHGANIEQADAKGWTPLMWAISRGQLSVVQILLAKNASTAANNRTGKTLADFARESGYSNIGKFIEDYLNTGELSKVEEYVLPPKENEFSSSSVKKYQKCDELDMFLGGLGLAEYRDTLRKHDVTFSQFMRMSDAELEKSGIDRVGARLKILENITYTHKQPWEKSSLPALQKKEFLSCPDFVAMCTNISLHLEYIKSTIGFVSDKIKASPELLEIGQEVMNVRHLHKQTCEGIMNCESLEIELIDLRKEIEKVMGKCEFQPADLITKMSKSSPKATRWKSVVSIALLGSAAIVIFWKKPEVLRLVSSKFV